MEQNLYLQKMIKDSTRKKDLHLQRDVKTADKIEKGINLELKKSKTEFPIYRCKTLKQAVETANEIAIKGDVVLFSPASASFDMFKNFAERGNKFKDLVKDLK